MGKKRSRKKIIQLRNPFKKNGSRGKILIGTPTYGGVPTKQYRESLIGAARELDRNKWEIVFYEPQGGNLAKNRIDCVEEALQVKADYLMFIDDDMVFQPDSIVDLLEHDLPVVSGLCVKKQYPYHTTVYVWNEEFKKYHSAAGFSDGGLFECDGTGTAFLLLKMEVFDKLAQPFFCFPQAQLIDDYEILYGAAKSGDADAIKKALGEIVPPDGDRDCTGEDLYLCQRLKRAGYKIFVDLDVVIGHLGPYAFTYMETMKAMEFQNTREQEEQPNDNGSSGQRVACFEDGVREATH